MGQQTGGFCQSPSYTHVHAASGGQIHASLGTQEEGLNTGFNSQVLGASSLQTNPMHNSTAVSGLPTSTSMQTDVHCSGTQVQEWVQTCQEQGLQDSFIYEYAIAHPPDGHNHLLWKAATKKDLPTVPHLKTSTTLCLMVGHAFMSTYACWFDPTSPRNWMDVNVATKTNHSITSSMSAPTSPGLKTSVCMHSIGQTRSQATLHINVGWGHSLTSSHHQELHVKPQGYFKACRTATLFILYRFEWSIHTAWLSLYLVYWPKI